MVFGFGMVAYADDEVAAPEEAVAEEAVEEEAAEPEVAVAAKADFADLAYTSVNYFNNDRLLLGTYPAVKDMDDLTDKIIDTIWRNYYYTYATDTDAAMMKNTYRVSFKVEDNNQFAKITLTIAWNKSTVRAMPWLQDFLFFVDKDGMVISDADAYDAYLKSLVAAEAEDEDEAILDDEDAVEEEMVDEAEAEWMLFGYVVRELGFEPSWDGDERIAYFIVGDDIGFFVCPDSNILIVYDNIAEEEIEVEMSAAAYINEDDRMVVPVDFLDIVLSFLDVEAE